MEISDTRSEEENGHEQIERPKYVLLKCPFGEKTKVTAVKWSKNGEMLAIGSEDGTTKVCLYESNQLKPFQSHQTHKEQSKDVRSSITITTTKCVIYSIVSPLI